jgi:uncharacterized protein (TIGR02270 family)
MPQYPIGFSPVEISSLVNEEVVARHVEEVAVLWNIRERAVHEPHYSLKDLERHDERLTAHLQGLALSGDKGWQLSRTAADEGGPGELFATAVLAFANGNRERMRDVVLAASRQSSFTRAVVSALGWLEYSNVSTWVGALLAARSPEHKRLGIAAAAINREDAGPDLNDAIGNTDPALRARALRAVGEIKRADLMQGVKQSLTDRDERCRFWSAWTLTLLGDPDGLDALAVFLERGDSVGERAIRLAFRAWPPDDSRAWISRASKRPDLARQCVLATGLLGDPSSVPWLVRRMEIPELARLAGEAFTMITGVDLAFADLDQEPPDGSPSATLTGEDELPELDYESNLRWPAPAKILSWWDVHQGAFQAGVRFLAGKPISRTSALETLVKGKQRQRAAAALELALLDSSLPLFEVRGRASWQRRKLQTWTS